MVFIINSVSNAWVTMTYEVYILKKGYNHNLYFKIQDALFVSHHVRHVSEI